MDVEKISGTEGDWFTVRRFVMCPIESPSSEQHCCPFVPESTFFIINRSNRIDVENEGIG